MCQCGGNCSSGCTTLKGDVGTPGSVWYNGIGVPSPSLGIVGDYYLDTATGNVYHKTATATWALQGNIKGSTGPAGAGGASVLYDDWTAVQNGIAAGYVDLKTTGTAVPLLTNGDILKISTGFTVKPTGSVPTIRLKLFYGVVNLAFATVFQITYGSTLTLSVYWDVEVSRISDLLIRYKSSIWVQDPLMNVTKSQIYFTTSDVAITSLTTGSIIKTSADGQTLNDVTGEYLKIIRFTV